MGDYFLTPNVLVQQAREAVQDFSAANKFSLETIVNLEKLDGESGRCSRMVALTIV